MVQNRLQGAAKEPLPPTKTIKGKSGGPVHPVLPRRLDLAGESRISPELDLTGAGSRRREPDPWPAWITPPERAGSLPPALQNGRPAIPSLHDPEPVGSSSTPTVYRGAGAARPEPAPKTPPARAAGKAAPVRSRAGLWHTCLNARHDLCQQDVFLETPGAYILYRQVYTSPAGDIENCALRHTSDSASLPPRHDIRDSTRSRR
jgi:hypothetical protein